MKETFVNPIYGGEDPFIIHGPDGFYYHCSATADYTGIRVYQSKKLTDRGIGKLVFTAPGTGWNACDVWAPEMWYLRGKWYIYYAASTAVGVENWQNHRMGVLEAENPMGPYVDKGKLELGEHMAIDGTVLETDSGELYMIYMRRNHPTSKLRLYIAPMDSPWHISGESQLLSEPEHPWEGTINEGPIPVNRNGRLRVLYSANSAGSPDYCLAALCCEDPSRILDRSAWKKIPYPLFKGNDSIIGPGHASITTSPDGTEDWLVFHSKSNLESIWPECWNRVVNIQKYTWDEETCLPIFGEAIPHGVPQALPSGQEVSEKGTSFNDDFRSGNDGWMAFEHFHRDSVRMEDGYYLLDGTQDADYGEKALVRNAIWDNCVVKATLSLGNSGRAGLLLRVHNVGDRKNLYTGYALFINASGFVTLGYSNGSQFHPLAEQAVSAAVEYHLTATLNDSCICVSINGVPVLSMEDKKFQQGSVGIVTDDASVKFTSFSVQSLSAH